MTQTALPTVHSQNGRSQNGAMANATTNVARARRQQRNRLVIAAAGFVVLALAVVVFETLVPRAPHERELLVADQSIRAGEVITTGDLKAISVASSQLAGVAVTQRDQVVGRTAGLDIGAGQPLVADDLGGVPGPGPGDAVVGVSLADGRFPAGLVVGDTVVIVDTPGDATTVGTTATPGVELAEGQALSVARSSDGTSTEVALIVPMTAADAVASASATESVSLVWVAQ